jgi:hypothetical protein
MKWLLVVLFTHQPASNPFMQLYTMPTEEVCWNTVSKGTWPTSVVVFCTLDQGDTPEVQTSAPGSRMP